MVLVAKQQISMQFLRNMFEDALRMDTDCIKRIFLRCSSADIEYIRPYHSFTHIM